MKASARGAAGITLLEVLVVLVVLGIMAGVSTAAFVSTRPRSEAPSDGVFARARRDAIEQGTAVRILDSTGRLILFLPDGRVLGPSRDPFDGALVSRP